METAEADCAQCPQGHSTTSTGDAGVPNKLAAHPQLVVVGAPFEIVPVLGELDFRQERNGGGIGCCFHLPPPPQLPCQILLRGVGLLHFRKTSDNAVRWIVELLLVRLDPLFVQPLLKFGHELDISPLVFSGFVWLVGGCCMNGLAGEDQFPSFDDGWLGGFLLVAPGHVRSVKAAAFILKPV